MSFAISLFIKVVDELPRARLYFTSRSLEMNNSQISEHSIPARLFSNFTYSLVQTVFSAWHTKRKFLTSSRPLLHNLQAQKSTNLICSQVEACWI